MFPFFFSPFNLIFNLISHISYISRELETHPVIFSLEIKLIQYDYMSVCHGPRGWSLIPPLPPPKIMDLPSSLTGSYRDNFFFFDL